MPYTLGSLIRGGWKEISCLSHKKLQSLSVTKIFNELEEVDHFSKSSIKRLQLLLVLWISTVHHSYHGTYQEFLSPCSIEFHSIIHLPIMHFVNGIQSGMGLSNIVLDRYCKKHFSRKVHQRTKIGFFFFEIFSFL